MTTYFIIGFVLALFEISDESNDYDVFEVSLRAVAWLFWWPLLLLAVIISKYLPPSKF